MAVAGNCKITHPSRQLRKNIGGVGKAECSCRTFDPGYGPGDVMMASHKIAYADQSEDVRLAAQVCARVLQCTDSHASEGSTYFGGIFPMVVISKNGENSQRRCERAKMIRRFFNRHVTAADNAVDDVVAGKKDEIWLLRIGETDKFIDFFRADIGRPGVQVRDDGDT